MRVALCGGRDWADRVTPHLRAAGVEIEALAQTVAEAQEVALLTSMALVVTGDLGISILRLVERTCPVLYALEHTDLPATRAAYRAGAAEVIVLPDESGSVPGILARLWDNDGARPAATPIGGAILVTSPKAGSGASVVACGIALALAHGGEEAALVDLHLPHGDQEVMMGVAVGHSLVDLLDYAPALEAGQIEQIASAHPSGVAVVCAPADHLHSERLGAVEARAIIETACLRWRWVVADVPPDHVADLASTATRILVVVTPHPLSIRSAYYLVKRTSLHTHRGCAAVVNQWSPQTAFTSAEVAMRIGLPLLGEIPLDGHLAYRVTTGEPIVSQTKKGAIPGEVALRRLATRVQVPVQAGRAR